MDTAKLKNGEDIKYEGKSELPYSNNFLPSEKQEEIEKRNNGLRVDELIKRTDSNNHTRIYLTMDICKNNSIENSTFISNENSIKSEAQKLGDSGKVTFTNAHASQINDEATAQKNIDSLRTGQPVLTSEYGHAMGKAVQCDKSLLEGLNKISEDHSIGISELAGENIQKQRATITIVRRLTLILLMVNMLKLTRQMTKNLWKMLKSWF